MAHDVFISYASEPEHSRQAANGVVHKLEGRGIRCWIAPRDMDPGEDYMGQLSEQVSASRALILVFSAEANHSPHVKREVGLAFENEVPILPFRIDDVQPDQTLKYCIGQVHWLDALSPPLEAHIEQLADRIETMLTEGTREHVEQIRERKDQHQWWRAVVWRMKRGGAALGTTFVSLALVLVLGVWGLNRFLDEPELEPNGSAGPPAQSESATDQSAANSPDSVTLPTSFDDLSEALANTIDRRSRGSAPISADALVEQIASALNCGGHECVLNPKTNFPPEVSKLYFGSSPEILDRFIDVQAEIAAEANRTNLYPVHYFPIWAAGGVFLQIETVEGDQSEVKEVSSSYGDGRDGKLARLVLEEGPSDVSDPGAFLSSREQVLGGVPLYVGSPTDIDKVRYAFDEGGFFEMPARSEFQGRPQVITLAMPVDAEMVRIQYLLSSGQEIGVFRYALPSFDAIQQDERKRYLIENLPGVVDCVRLVPLGPNASISDIALADVTFRMSSVSSYPIERSNVTICLPRTTGDRQDSWTAVSVIEFRTDAGTEISAPVSVGNQSNISYVRDHEIWSVELPELARAIYAQLVFFDGSRSDEVRIPVNQVDLQ